MIDFDTARAEFESHEWRAEWRFDRSFDECTFCASVAWDPCDETNEVRVICWGDRWEVAVTDDSGASYFAATESLDDTIRAGVRLAIDRSAEAGTDLEAFKYSATASALLGLSCPGFTLRHGPPYSYASEPE